MAVQLAWHPVQQASSKAPRGDHRDLYTGATAEREAGVPQLHCVAYSHEYPTLQQSDKGLLSTRFSIIFAKLETPNASGE